MMTRVEHKNDAPLKRRRNEKAGRFVNAKNRVTSPKRSSQRVLGSSEGGVKNKASVPKYLQRFTSSEFETYRRIAERVDYVPHSVFHHEKAEDRFFGPQASRIKVPEWANYSEEDFFSTAKSVQKVKLSGAEEKELFLRYNYACYRLSKLVDAQRQRRSAGRARQMVLWQRRMMETRSALTGANLALVLAMAKRTRIPNVEFSELISEGNMALLRAIEKFDVSRGFKFSTYACRAILKSFNRLATKTGRYRQLFPTEYDPELERSDYDVMRHEIQRDDSVDSLREIINRNLANLSQTERTIVIERFALGSAGKKQTLGQVGEMVGLTNERVRQIQNHALDKLRLALDEQCLVA